MADPYGHGMTAAEADQLSTRMSRDVGEPSGLVLNVYGDLRQGGCVLRIVVRAEQQFPEAGQQDPDVSLSAAAVTSVHGGKTRGEGLSSGRRQLLTLLTLSSASAPELAGAHGVYLLRSGGERLASSSSHALVDGKAMASVVALPSAIRPGEAPW
jgi:hypothetical protein